MVSFPIPHTGKYADRALSRYTDLSAEGISFRERIEQLRAGRTKPFDHEFCHHDPDLVRDMRARPSLAGWRGIFGQSGGRQSHLMDKSGGGKNKIKAGDLFLFFGYFKEAERMGNTLRFRRGTPKVQALFGFLQIGEMLPARDAARKHKQFRDHPHLTQARLEWDKTPEAQKERHDNTVYVAAERLSFPGMEHLPGWGVLRHSDALVLTASKEEQKRHFGAGKKPRRTVWNLDKVGEGKIFRDKKITHHSEESWLSEGGLFQSAYPGQEFVIYDDDGKVSEWAAKLIRRHYLRS